MTAKATRLVGLDVHARQTHAAILDLDSGEAAHHYRYPPRIGDTLARRQAGQDPRIIAIAWRAQRRLHARWQHLRHTRRKPAGVVAIAVSRELAAFLWEAATLD